MWEEIKTACGNWFSPNIWTQIVLAEGPPYSRCNLSSILKSSFWFPFPFTCCWLVFYLLPWFTSFANFFTYFLSTIIFQFDILFLNALMCPLIYIFYFPRKYWCNGCKNDAFSLISVSGFLFQLCCLSCCLSAYLKFTGQSWSKPPPKTPTCHLLSGVSNLNAANDGHGYSPTSKCKRS